MIILKFANYLQYSWYVIMHSPVTFNMTLLAAISDRLISITTSHRITLPSSLYLNYSYITVGVGYHSRSRMSLLLYKSEAKPRTSVNNKDTVQ